MNLEKITKYNKLVRDHIPKVIRGMGKEPKVRIIENQDEYVACLQDKLQEEVNEYLADQSGEELADILEVVYACAALQQITPEGLEVLRKKKYDARGGFVQRIYLESVKEQ